MSQSPSSNATPVWWLPCRAVFRVGVILATVAGCGGGGEIQLPKAEGNPIPVSGKVLLPSGQPLAGGKVIFVPAKPPGVEARGTTGSDGSFKLTSREDNDGALPGDYRVRIEPAPQAKGTTKRVPPPFASEYLDEDATDLTATVSPANTSFEFKLKANLPGAAAKRGRSRD